MSTNHAGQPIREAHLFKHWSREATPAEIESAIRLLCEHLNVRIYLTNATKHGMTEMVLREET